MDFIFTPEADDAAQLSAQILADATGTERLKAVEAAAAEHQGRFDRDLWRTLGEAGLLSLHLPEEYGGAGLGLTELARVLVEVGRTVAPIPLAIHGPAGLFLAESGAGAAHLAGIASGETVISVAAAEPLSQLPEGPTVTADDEDRLTGTKSIVRAGVAADLLLVTATGPAGPGVWLVEATAAGLSREPQRTSDGDLAALITLDRTPGVRLPGTLARLHDLVVAAAAAEQLGVTEGALTLTAAYAKTREQFGRPIGTFQAVGQRLADGFIDVLAQRLTLWQAIWRLTEGLDATSEVAVAKLWAADAGHRLAHTTVHVHGGVGIDLDGTAHRYFTAAKRFEFTGGGTTEQAHRIGAALATASDTRR